MWTRGESNSLPPRCKRGVQPGKLRALKSYSKFLNLYEETKTLMHAENNRDSPEANVLKLIFYQSHKYLNFPKGKIYFTNKG